MINECRLKENEFSSLHFFVGGHDGFALKKKKLVSSSAACSTIDDVNFAWFISTRTHFLWWWQLFFFFFES